MLGKAVDATAATTLSIVWAGRLGWSLALLPAIRRCRWEQVAPSARTCGRRGGNRSSPLFGATTVIVIIIIIRRLFLFVPSKLFGTPGTLRYDAALDHGSRKLEFWGQRGHVLIQVCDAPLASIRLSAALSRALFFVAAILQSRAIECTLEHLGLSSTG
ncbi:MAG TPA: hypothetical protein PKX17_05700, partial [Candidatus Methanomethylicus sp.]|nr:hypothetical protein [Candidatus Methanomethylicus sp.]